MLRIIIPESGRWYDRAGLLVTEVPSADGKKQVRPTVAHARKLGLLPSVTSIVRQIDKPGLRHWRDQQLIEAALSLPRPADTTDAQWNDPKTRAAAVLADAEEQVEAAAERGKDWHSMIERALADNVAPVDPMAQVAFGEVQKLLSAFGMTTLIVERTVLGPGFAGTPDILASDKHGRRLLADIKTVADDSPLLAGKGRPYDEWLWQIAAYWRCTASDIGKCWEVLIGRETGRVRLHHWTQTDILTGWQVFEHLFALWCLRNNYNPLTWTGQPETKKESR